MNTHDEIRDKAMQLVLQGNGNKAINGQALVDYDLFNYENYPDAKSRFIWMDGTETIVPAAQVEEFFNDYWPEQAMKIYIRLSSVHFTDEQNQMCFENLIELDWNLPFLPNEHDLFDNSIMDENMPDFAPELSWSVTYAHYIRMKGKIVPIINLDGE